MRINIGDELEIRDTYQISTMMGKVKHFTKDNGIIFELQHFKPFTNIIDLSSSGSKYGLGYGSLIIRGYDQQPYIEPCYTIYNYGNSVEEVLAKTEKIESRKEILI